VIMYVSYLFMICA